MGLRPTNGEEDLSGADPLVRAGPPGPALRGFIDFSSRPTRASAADQGVRPTCSSMEPKYKPPHHQKGDAGVQLCRAVKRPVHRSSGFVTERNLNVQNDGDFNSRPPRAGY